MTLALLGLFTDLNDRFSYPFYILYLLKSLRFTDSFSCPWETQALTFSINSTRLTRTAPLMFVWAGFNRRPLYGVFFSPSPPPPPGQHYQHYQKLWIRDGPLEKLWGGGRSTKKYSRKGKLNKKKFMHVN